MSGGKGGAHGKTFLIFFIVSKLMVQCLTKQRLVNLMKITELLLRLFKKYILRKFSGKIIWFI